MCISCKSGVLELLSEKHLRQVCVYALFRPFPYIVIHCTGNQCECFLPPPHKNILLSNMYGKISRVVKARITRVPEARVQYGALTTSGILPYAFENVFIICLAPVREKKCRLGSSLFK